MSSPGSALRVVVISHLFPNRQDPVRGVFVLEQVRELKKLCGVTVVAPIPWFPPFKGFRKWYGYRQIPRQEVTYGIEVLRPRWLTFPRGHLLPVMATNYLSCLGRFLSESGIDFDIIHAHTVFPDGYAAARLGSKWCKPVVITSHGADTFQFLRRFDTRPMASYAIRNADKLIAVSESDKNELIRHGLSEEKAVVIPNGIDTARFLPMEQGAVRQRLGLPVDKRIVLYVGYLYPVKGLRYLIDALAMVRRSGEDVLLVVVGYGYLREKLENQSRDLGPDAVKFVGFQPHDEIPLWMNACDVFCLPSLNEGWPTVLFEAMACGKPVVATAVGGVPEVVKDSDYGILVPPMDAGAFGSALGDALRRKWRSSDISAYARVNSWENIALEIYERAFREFVSQ